MRENLYNLYDERLEEIVLWCTSLDDICQWLGVATTSDLQKLNNNLNKLGLGGKFYKVYKATTDQILTLNDLREIKTDEFLNKTFYDFFDFGFNKIEVYYYSGSVDNLEIKDFLKGMPFEKWLNKSIKEFCYKLDCYIKFLG